MQSALLWYQTFKGQLESMGFKLNPYDPCVANMEINDYQCTVCWYVDDVKISHQDPKVVDELIALLEKQFRKMTVTRGKRHTYLGMNINFNDDGNISIEMKDYLKKSIDAFGEQIKGTAPPPEKKNDLFDTNNTTKQL